MGDFVYFCVMNKEKCNVGRSSAATEMRKKISTVHIGILGVIAAAVLSTACANMGHPSGGPRDEDPPRLVSASPAPGSINVGKPRNSKDPADSMLAGQRITLTFNELVNVKDAFTKVVVSPASKSVPKVSSGGRNVYVDFDSLAPNTTYTIDFADAIEDNNEGNKLSGFAYSFSTGPVLDTLRISGRVLSARALEPQKGILVGVHSNLSDTAFSTTRLLRVARTDDRGRFTIRGLAAGEYRVFALEDKDNDQTYSSPEENMAWYDVTVSPSSRPVVELDSVYNPLTGELDTVVTRNRTQFLPNDIVLRSFNSELRQQYMTKYERTDSTRIFLKFNTRLNSLPTLRLLDNDGYRTPGVLEASERLDSLVWWLAPGLVSQDTLRVAVTYPRSDMSLREEVVTDTLSFITARPRGNKKQKKEEKTRMSAADSIAAVTTAWKAVSGRDQDVYLPVVVETALPITGLDLSKVRLREKVDTVWRTIGTALPEDGEAPRFSFAVKDSLKPRERVLEYPWEFGKTYALEIDSLAATDIYGKPTWKLLHEFTVRKSDDYCSVNFEISGTGGVPAFVELLNGSDAVVRTAQVKDGEAYFPFLMPGKYYARIILDENGNGVYDTGDYREGRQPELAYYYPRMINIKKMWDQQVKWNVFETPVDMMKPEAVLKNKPTVDSRNRKQQTATPDDEDDETFDPNRNPFDPNYRRRN